MTDKWIGPRRVLCGDSNPPPDGYEYVRRYADDVRLAAGSGTTVENENVADYVAFRRDWMHRHRLCAESCSLVDVTGDSMEPELFDGDAALVDHSRCAPVEGAVVMAARVVVMRAPLPNQRNNDKCNYRRLFELPGRPTMTTSAHRVGVRSVAGAHLFDRAGWTPPV